MANVVNEYRVVPGMQTFIDHESIINVSYIIVNHVACII